MVLLGKSGIGKSTWINSFFNFFMLESFESGLREESVYAPIHTQFKHADMTIESDFPEDRLVTIEVGEKENLCEEYAMGNVTASSTMMPISHIVEPRDAEYVIRLIDTPGIKSTIGKGNDKTTDEVDKANINMILDHISQYPYINAFIVMLKPDEEKLDPTFASILKALFGQLGESARKNVIFAFTHSRNCDFQDTKTVSVLSGYLKEENLDIKIKDSNVFYFDSSPFRYLATLSQGHTPKEDRLLMKLCWNQSVESCKNMIKFIDEELEKHDTKETLAVSDTKSLITLVIKPLVQICKVTEENIAVVKKHLEDLTVKSGRIAVKTIDMREKVLTLKTLDKPLTVCAHVECFEKHRVFEDGEKVERNLYRKVCCKDCRVPFVSDQVKGCRMLFFCAAMTWGGVCKVCKHSKNDHMHIFYEMFEAENLFKMETKDIAERKNELIKELEFIVDTLAFFSKYLECHSLIKDRDIVAARIDEEKVNAQLELGGAVKVHAEAEKKVQEHSLPSKHEIEKNIVLSEGELTVVQDRKNVVNELLSSLDDWNFHSRVENDGEMAYKRHRVKVKNLEARIKIFAKEDNSGGIEFYEYYTLLKAKETSLMEHLKQLKYNLQLIQDLEDAQRQIEEKTMLIDALEKTLQKYEDKLSYERNDLTPAVVTKRFNTLCGLKHSGPTFQEIHDFISGRRNNDVVKKKKFYTRNNIPCQRFLPRLKRAIEN